MPSHDREQRRELLQATRRSIEHGVERGVPLLPDPAAYGSWARAPGASFVTLERAGALRGCMGSLEASRPLVVDAAHNAFAAAFHDPRFAPLDRTELGDLDVHVSVLSRPEPLAFASEADLLTRLRPGVDGLILEDAGRRATFLPAVWEKLPDPREFLRELKRKAGLDPDRTSMSLQVWRYTAERVD
jgi:AmmeMemoRadiSam system protein A